MNALSCVGPKHQLCSWMMQVPVVADIISILLLINPWIVSAFYISNNQIIGTSSSKPSIDDMNILYVHIR